jgi:hypothetical protein
MQGQLNFKLQNIFPTTWRNIVAIKPQLLYIQHQKILRVRQHHKRKVIILRYVFQLIMSGQIVTMSPYLTPLDSSL